MKKGTAGHSGRTTYNGSESEEDVFSEAMLMAISQLTHRPSTTDSQKEPENLLIYRQAAIGLTCSKL